MVDEARSLLIADASVLINFLVIDRVDLLAALPYKMIVTEHVEVEIDGQYPEHVARFRTAQFKGLFEVVRVDQPEELKLFARLQADGRLGLGECSAFACASCRRGVVAIDDKVAIRRARETLPNLEILGTIDIVVMLIRQKVLDVSEADAIKDQWAAKHRFRLKVISFSDLI